jgi:LSD1 subclass zinc finger protein
MPKQHKRIESCKICGRATNHAYICRGCANELHDLLVGSSGITWYVKRLRESAYGQARLGRSVHARGTVTGYALLGNRQAAQLLARSGTVLARWEVVCDRLRATYGNETDVCHSGHPTRDSERLEVKRATYIAANVVLIRHHCAEAPKLHAEMLDCARTAWRIINRPNDICCGACPTMIYDDSVNSAYAQSHDNVSPCGTLLYAEDGASGVQCPRCHTMHNVEALRESLRNAVQDMLFTRDELIRLMETRLNDRIPHSTFGKLLRDGRLQPRHVDDDGIAWFTYNDVCEARLKPGRKPGPKAAS